MNISTPRYQPADLPEILTLLQTELPAHDISESQFVRKVLLDSNFDPEGALVARDPSGASAGFLLAITRKTPFEGGPVDQHRGWITLFAVRSDLRRQSIGSQLFEAAENYLRSKRISEIWISPYTPYYWTPGVDEATYPAALEFLKCRGYETTSRPLAMSTDLKGPRSMPTWAVKRELELNREVGLIIEPISSVSVLPLMLFLAVEFPGDWQRHVRETIDAIFHGYRSSEDVIVASRNGEIVGFAHMDGERFGPFGVGTAQRGKGVGAILLYRSLESMHRRGSKRAWFMWTGDEPAKRVYSPAGFIETNRFSILVKKL